MNEPDVPPEWQRGVLSTSALAVLAHGSAHGYAVAQQLQAAGIGPVKGGALYPVLNRLEEDGAVTSAWQEGDGGPGRKVFTLTDEGWARLAALRERWQPFSAAMTALLVPTPLVPNPLDPTPLDQTAETHEGVAP